MADNAEVVRRMGTLVDLVRERDSRVAGQLSNTIGRLREYQGPAETITKEVLEERGVPSGTVPYLVRLFQGVDPEVVASLVPERRYRSQATGFRGGLTWSQ